MCTLGLFALIIFFPAFAHAATPPSLTSYTVSHDTIYPDATVESGLATTTSIDIAFSEQVKVSIKITSASGTTIKSLYSSSSVTNPDKKIWDGTNTAGTRVGDGMYTILISATSTASDGLTMTDSSKTVTVASSDSTSPDTSPDSSSDSTIATTASQSGAPPEYIPIPTLRIVTSGNRTVSAGADTTFTAVVYDGRGNKRDDAIVMWSFGDGMQRTGASVFHAYYEPGEYIVVVHATTADGGDVLNDIVMTVKDARIKIASVSSRGITLMNNDSRTLDLSLWRLSVGGQEFKIPIDTKILAGRSTLFPSQVIGLSVTGSALLLYPSGEVASTYPEIVTTAVQQPFTSVTSYEKVQAETSPITSTKANIQTHEKAVRAPTAATELAAVGATLPLPLDTTKKSSMSSIFHSPWTLGFFGIMTLAAAAFILL